MIYSGSMSLVGHTPSVSNKSDLLQLICTDKDDPVRRFVAARYSLMDTFSSSHSKNTLMGLYSSQQMMAMLFCGISLLPTAALVVGHFTLASTANLHSYLRNPNAQPRRRPVTDQPPPPTTAPQSLLPRPAAFAIR